MTSEPFVARLKVPPPVRSRWQVTRDGGVTFNLTGKMPNHWHRFWQWVFFGFVWRKP